MIVYKITNEVNGHSYVGFTSQPMMKRFHAHMGSARRGAKWPLHNAIRKYGKENFSVKTLYEGKDALEQEDKYIKKHGYYNIAPGGYSVMLGVKRTFTKEWKENMSKSALERSKEFPKWVGKDNPQYGKQAYNAVKRIYKGIVYNSLYEMSEKLNISRHTARKYWRVERGIQSSQF